jgi:hypothetical protein
MVRLATNVSAPDLHLSAPHGRPRLRLHHVLLAIWAVLAFVVTASLASAHLFTLPRPKSTEAVGRALAAERAPSERGHWSATHVMYLECNCSKRILDHLLRRRKLQDVGETVLMVGSDAALSEKLVHAGFSVVSTTAEMLAARYQIVSAPLLIVSDPQDEVRYLGGYTEQQQGLDLRDSAIIASLRAGGREIELPLLGCTTSASLQKILDPFGLKYSKQRSATP